MQLESSKNIQVQGQKQDSGNQQKGYCGNRQTEIKIREGLGEVTAVCDKKYCFS